MKAEAGSEQAEAGSARPALRRCAACRPPAGGVGAIWRLIAWMPGRGRPSPLHRVIHLRRAGFDKVSGGGSRPGAMGEVASTREVRRPKCELRRQKSNGKTGRRMRGKMRGRMRGQLPGRMPGRMPGLTRGLVSALLRGLTAAQLYVPFAGTVVVSPGVVSAVRFRQRVGGDAAGASPPRATVGAETASESSAPGWNPTSSRKGSQ